LARVNYQREKRLKDLDRQRKQEEKRSRRLNKDGTPEVPVEGVEVGTEEGLEAPVETIADQAE